MSTQGIPAKTGKRGGARLPAAIFASSLPLVRFSGGRAMGEASSRNVDEMFFILSALSISCYAPDRIRLGLCLNHRARLIPPQTAFRAAVGRIDWGNLDEP